MKYKLILNVLIRNLIFCCLTHRFLDYLMNLSKIQFLFSILSERKIDEIFRIYNKQNL